MTPESTTGRPSTLSLPSDVEIRIERTFAAPRDRVWRAWTDPEMFPKWMGPARHQMTHSEFDARDGGKYRWVWPMEDGPELVIHGDVLAIDAPCRMATREFMELGEPLPSYTVNLLVFTETDHGTTVAVHVTFSNQEARDGALASGMKDGMDEGFGRLDLLLPELA